MRRLLFVATVVISMASIGITLFTLNSIRAWAQECQVDLQISPDGPYVKGQEIWIGGSSNCTTVKWRINDDTKYEIGDSGGGTWWRTDKDEYPPGEYEVCMYGRRSSEWDYDGIKDCTRVTLNSGGPGPNPNLQGCRIVSFSVSPQSNHIDGDFSISGIGECGGEGVRAIKFRVGGDTIYEIGSSSATTMWRPDYTGSPSVCMLVTMGDWYDQDETASECTEITITGSGTPPSNEVAVPTQQPPPSNPSQPSNPSSPSVSPTSVPSNNGGSGGGGGGGSNCNSLSRLYLGATAYINDDTPGSVPLRTGPARSYKQILEIAIRERVSIRGGPSCDGNFVWWQVSYNGQPGWMAEINGQNYRNLVLVENQTPSSDLSEIDKAILSLEPSCISMQSAQLVHRSSSHHTATCISLLFEMSIPDASALILPFLECGAIPVLELIAAVYEFRATGSLAYAISENITSETIANCAINFLADGY